MYSSYRWGWQNSVRFLCSVCTLSKTSGIKPKEHLESLGCACWANLKLEQLEMWPMRIKAAAYIYMLHIHAALNEQKISAIWRSHTWKVFVRWNSYKIGNLTLFFPTFGSGVCQCVLCWECTLVSRRQPAFKVLNFLKLLPLRWRQSTSESICSAEHNQIAQAWTQRKTALLLSSHQTLRLLPLVKPSLSFHFTVPITF